MIAIGRASANKLTDAPVFSTGASAGNSTSASTIAMSSTISQPTAMRPRSVSSKRRSCIARSSTTVLATDKARPNTTPNVASAADRMAAAMRRLNRPQEAAQWMLHSAKARSDETERTRSEEDIKTFNAAVAADEASPSAASLKGVHDAIDKARSVLGKRVALARLEARLQHALSPDRDEDAFLREATRLMLGGQVQPQTATPEDLGAGGGARPKPMTAEEAWRQAAEKHPQGLAKMVSRQLIGGKKELPDEIWDILRWPKPIQTKDASLPRRAALIVQEEVKAERAQGKQVSPLDFTKRWNAKIIELEGAEARAKKTPDELAAAGHRAAILRVQREVLEKPESL